MALPHEVPAERPDVTDPAYLRFVWARYLRQEIQDAKKNKRKLIPLTLEGALEIATALDPTPRKVR